MKMPDGRQKDSHDQVQRPDEADDIRNEGCAANYSLFDANPGAGICEAQVDGTMSHRHNSHPPAPGSMSSSEDNVSDKLPPTGAFTSYQPSTGDSDSFIADWKRYYDNSAQQLQQQQQETLKTVYENMTHSSTPQCSTSAVDQQQQQQQQHRQQPRPPLPPPQQHHQQPLQQQDNLSDLMRINEGLIHGSSELMNVYDNLTQEGIAPQAEAMSHGGQQQQQQIDSFSYGNIPIPAAPAVGSLDAASSANGTSGRRRGGSRSLRKRNSSTANLDNNNDETGSTSGGSDTKQQKSSKSRRKTKGEKESTDGRWSKRFTWPEELHRDFVSAIFDVGLKHSSPSAILECMPKHAQITSERVKSHLQKYRLNRAKSKRDFITSYEESVKRMQKDGVGKIQSLSSGEVPAHLTYGALTGQEVPAAPAAPDAEKGGASIGTTPGVERRGASNATKPGSTASVSEGAATSNQAANELQGSLMLPRLTEEEKKSPIGASMGYLMGLFFSLKQQLMAQRVAKSQHAGVTPAAPVSGGVKQNQPVTAVFDSFVSGKPPQSQPAPVTVNNNMPAPPPLPPPPAAASRASLTTPVVATSTSNPSTRSNLEESNMMKREMQNQMAFQNKMRALKQQEVNKYRRTGSGEVEQQNNNHQQQQQQLQPQQQGESQQRHVVFADDTGGGLDAGATAKATEYDEQEFQGAGETAAADNSNGGGNRLRGISIGGADDFWNTDVMDEQLFEFLMNN